MTTTKDKTCAERIENSYAGRIENLKDILTCSGDFAHCEDLMQEKLFTIQNILSQTKK